MPASDDGRAAKPLSVREGFIRWAARARVYFYPSFEGEKINTPAVETPIAATTRRDQAHQASALVLLTAEHRQFN
jgi:hypothetical protein